MDVTCPLAEALAERLRGARTDLTRRWLDRIGQRASIEPGLIFPSTELLDHIPLLMDGIADYMSDRADEIGADDLILTKAMELGELRHGQGFGAHEVLKEYEILGGVLFAFLIRIVDDIDQECTRGELLACGHRLFRAVTVIQEVTMTHYLRVADQAVREREDRLRSFNLLVTHELKNRISAVGGATEMLREPWVAGNEEQRDRFLSILSENVAGMETMVDDILLLTRTHSASRPQRHVELPAVAAEAARQLRAMSEDRGVEVRLAQDLPEVEVDSAAVQLCLINYLSNAIKYADQSKPEPWVEVRASLTNGERGEELVVEVRDNGIGVPPNLRDRLFQRFFRADEIASGEGGSSGDGRDREEGSGLGLSIVRETVESLGGRAWAEFDSAEGSVFKFSLPTEREDDVYEPDGK